MKKTVKILGKHFWSEVLSAKKLFEIVNRIYRKRIKEYGSIASLVALKVSKNSSNTFASLN